MPADLAAIVAKCGHVFRLEDALRCAATVGQIRGWLKRGAVVRLRHGVYAVAGAAGIDLAPKAIGAAVAGTDRVVCLESAALLLGLPVWTPGDGTTVTRPVVPGRTPDTSPSTVLASGLPAHHRTLIGETGTTSAARTVVDLGRRRPFDVAVVTADGALRKGVRREELERVLLDCYNWPGIRRAQKVVEFADPRAESPLESMGRARVVMSGMPVPDLQVWLGEHEDELVRVDGLYRPHWTVLEFDGRTKYKRNDDLLDAERLRDELLNELGYEVLHLGWAHMKELAKLGPRIERACERGRRRHAA